ncbi:CBS domain-containing protein [Methanospirillum sp.]|uniref:CBS domain-containing protein n=1 Tax=Methanospirillum sp. TaxID=45200 RepID=UPI00298340D3|nr:CBS domain-containing protein [Methanospirillum sp.]
MIVRDAMTKDPVTCQAKDSIADVAGIMRSRKIGGIPILDEDKLAGIVTETDILKLLKTKGPSDDLWLPSPLEIIELPVREFINWENTKKALTDIREKKIADIMSKPVITISPGDDIEIAAQRMLEKKIDRLCVMENDRLVGIITRQDIVWSLAGGKNA